MKKMISLLLVLVLTLTIVSGCAEKTIPEEQPVEIQSEYVEPAEPEEETIPAPQKAEPEIEDPALGFEKLSDPELLTYMEDCIYSSLEYDFASDDYQIEDVAAVYISKEYLEEVAYNSKENEYFGYTLSELDAEFDGDRYVFTLGDNGETIVEKLEAIDDDTYNQVLKNVAIGTGVILVCVTVSVVTAGAGAPAAVSAIFAASAKTGAIAALSGGTISAAMHGIVTGYQTGDVHEAMRVAALHGSEGFKWGAISGAIAGGAQKAIRFHHISKPGYIPTPKEAEQYALEVFKGKREISYLNGQEVKRNVLGATRPDIVRNVHGTLEAIEVKDYNLASPTSFSELCRELKRQVSARLLHLPEGSTQRIALVTKGRGYSKELLNDVIERLHYALDDIYPNIPIEVLN